MIIDTQSHWYSPTLLEAYLDRDTFPRTRRQNGSFAIERSAGFWFELPRSFVDLEAGLEAMARAGVDATLSSSASYGDVDYLPVAQAREVALALNQERETAEREHPGRFYGLATLPWQDTDAALAVLDDAVRRGLRGAVIHSNVAGEPVEVEPRLPVFRRLAELGMPLFLHPGRSVSEPHLRYGMEYMVGFLYDTTTAALGMVLAGVLEDCPGLEVVLPHGGSTLPYLIGRIDALMDRPYIQARDLPHLPSHYLQSFFYTDSACFNRETLDRAIEFFGPERMLLGTDYPFFPPEHGVGFVREGRDPGEVELVFDTNPRRLLRLA
jgi:predicted TIM-barrel fold metal-dependent hydrolase